MDYVNRYDIGAEQMFGLGAISVGTTVVSTLLLSLSFGFFGLLGLLPAAAFISFYTSGNKFRMVHQEAAAWDDYRALSPASRKALNITPKYLRSIPAGEDWDRLRTDLKVLLNTEQNALREKELLSGRTGQTFQTIDNLIEGAKSDLKTLSAIRKDMT